MRCPHFEAGRCRSCTLLPIPYAVQLADKQARARAALDPHVPVAAWDSPHASPEFGFRNRAKLVVGGAPGAVTLGILDTQRRGIDLRDCGLYEPALAAALPPLAALLDDLRLLPYDVAKARGELKYVHVTASPDGDLMVRCVLRSDRQAARVRAALPSLHASLPGLRVLSLNYLPDHVALLEGPDEEVLTSERTLPMRLPRLTLRLGPRSFFQTNTTVAAALYAQASAWIEQAAGDTLLDLFCGVGGFALHAALLPSPPAVHGVEVSEDAIVSARHTAAGLRAQGRLTRSVTFDAADATSALTDADTIVVNPPRRGLGRALTADLDKAPARTLIYSSCDPRSLAADLSAMPSWQVRRARLFDMFPQTTHAEVLVLAERA